MSDTNPQMVEVDRGNAVIATTYVFVIVTLAFTGLRIATAFLRSRKFGSDDALLILAMFFGLLSAICTGTAVMNGLGRSITTVHSNQLYNYFKLSYSSHIFMILALASAKHSVVELLQRLVPSTAPRHRHIRLFHAVIACWTLYAVFGIALQCGFPAPWIYAPSRCSGHGAVWYPIAILDILTDIALAFGFFLILETVPMDAKKRLRTRTVFLCRLIVPVLAVVHIIVLASALNATDQTQAMTVPSILAQITMDLSIVTAGLLALSRTIVSLEPSTPAAVVSEITAVSLDPHHNRAVSDENNKLRDWALTQLRNTPTPSSMTKEMSVDLSSSPKKPAELHLRLSRIDTAPPIPPRSERRSASPQLTLNFTHVSPHLDVKEAWFVDSKRTSSNTENSLDESKRASTLHAL